MPWLVFEAVSRVLPLTPPLPRPPLFMVFLVVEEGMSASFPFLCIPTPAHQMELRCLPLESLTSPIYEQLTSCSTRSGTTHRQPWHEGNSPFFPMGDTESQKSKVVHCWMARSPWWSEREAARFWSPPSILLRVLGPGWSQHRSVLAKTSFPKFLKRIMFHVWWKPVFQGLRLTGLFPKCSHLSMLDLETCYRSKAIEDHLAILFLMLVPLYGRFDKQNINKLQFFRKS